MNKVQDLLDMGYSRNEAEQALAVAEGDMEQAIGFLLAMQGSGIFNFDGCATAYSDVVIGIPQGTRSTTAAMAAVSSPRGRAAILATTSSRGGGREESPTMHMPSMKPLARPGAFAVETNNVEEIMKMGYSEKDANDALALCSGDLGRSVNYLLLCETSHHNSRQDGNQEQKVEDSVASIDNDAAMAAMLQEDEMMALNFVVGLQLEDSNNVTYEDEALYNDDFRYNNNADTVVVQSPRGKNTPRMVSTESFLNIDGAGPYCACAAASKFLNGGVVTSNFLHEILQTGTEIFRKKPSNANRDVAQVLQKYGKSHLGIDADVKAGSPMVGVYMKNDVEISVGLRKLLAACRNVQTTGWQALVLEVDHLEHFCIALPPKGSVNKFWFIDCRPRACFRVEGAYAMVHNTMAQLAESLETILNKLSRRDHESFNLHIIKKSKGDA